MNLDILSDWWLKALKQMEVLAKGSKLYESISWVYDYKELIVELDIINKVFAEIRRITKRKGLSRRTVNKAAKLFGFKTENEHIKYLNENILEYFSETLNQLPDEGQILCTSDIIESCFGKYKN